jgi:MFS family permease
MTVVVSILFSDIIPLRERGTWQGYLNIVYATGFALGGPLGGLLADTIGWRVRDLSLCFIYQVPYFIGQQYELCSRSSLGSFSLKKHIANSL